MEQQIRFCTTSDGVRIAYTTLGSGPPLVATMGSWQSIRYELEDTYGGRFFEALAQRYTVVRYDRRGVGLSDRERTDFTVDADVWDLETVVHHLGLKRFALMGSFHLGPSAITYAARHARLVSRLILYGTYAYGRELTRDEIKASITSMMRSHWGMASRTLADITAPGAEGEMLDRIAGIYRESASGKMAADLLDMAYSTDVLDLLPKVRAPTLVLHRQGDRAVPFSLGRELTSLLPNARLVTLEGNSHWPWLGDSDSIVKAMCAFLEEEGPARGQRPQAREGLVTILFTDVQGSTSLTQRLGDTKAREVLRAHDGSEVKTMGDGFMASFTSATRSLECAIAVQRAFAEHNESAEERIRVRIGLNAGEPIAEEEDLFGTAVIMAARIAARAEGGEILVANVVRELAAGKGFLFSDRGDTALRGFDDPVRLYEVRWEERA